jgi:fructokinase
LNHACAIGAIVAQSEGANPVILQSEIDEFLCGFDHTSDAKKSNTFSNN